MRRPAYSSIVPAFASMLLVLTSCGEVTAPVSPVPEPAGEARNVAGVSTQVAPGASILACPATTTATAQETIGLLGGRVSAGGTTIVIPPGAVLLPRSFRVTVPASPLMEVQIVAEGSAHFQFLLPVRVTIDYSRCGNDPAADAPLSVYYISDLTKSLLQLMAGWDDKAARRYTFVTDHLSGYAIAN